MGHEVHHVFFQKHMKVFLGEAGNAALRLCHQVYCCFEQLVVVKVLDRTRSGGTRTVLAKAHVRHMSSICGMSVSMLLLQCVWREAAPPLRAALHSIVPKQFFSSTLILASGRGIRRRGAGERWPRLQRHLETQHRAAALLSGKLQLILR